MIRAARPDDAAAIAAVVAATGLEDDWSGRNPAYVRHMLQVGRVLVAEADGRVVGFGAAQQVGSVSMLGDLFIDPAVHGSGIGRSILTELWADATRRMLFSSLHSNALPLYTSFGLDAWWPLLYLHGDVRALPLPPGWTAAPAAPDQVSALVLAWTGIDRTADCHCWAARPNGAGVVVLHGGAPVAAGTAAGPPDDFGLVRLAMNPDADDQAAVAAVLTALAGLTQPGPATTVYLPAPHPAVRALLGAGWRVREIDLFMASEPGLLDPRRAVPSVCQA